MNCFRFMSARDAALTLHQIVDLCDKALDLRGSTTHKEFSADWRKQMLAERLMEVIGEAVKRLPEELCARYPETPWRKIASTRDYIAHGYDSVDYDVIWSVIDLEAARLRECVQRMFEKESAGNSLASHHSGVIGPLPSPLLRPLVDNAL